jgi:nicotinamide-nucleotide amidase
MMRLEKLIGDLLREKGWTLSIAESCTGGLVCDRITNVSGSSDYFEGGMVTYSNESKEKHLGIPLRYIERYGAVSPQVARRMAQGVRRTLSTKFGLSTTGVAGPTGGTKKSPVGRVFIGLAAGRKVWVRKLDLKGDRREIKEKATEKALQFFLGKIANGRRLRKQATLKK